MRNFDKTVRTNKTSQRKVKSESTKRDLRNLRKSVRSNKRNVGEE